LKNLTKIWFFLVLILIVSLFIRDNVRSMDKAKEGFTVNNYLENPQKYGGVKLENFGRIVNINQDHFYLNIGGRDLKVYGSGIKRPILGEIVVYINYNKNGRLEMIDYHTYDYNYVLYGISFFALILFIIIFFREWKFTWRGFKDA